MKSFQKPGFIFPIGWKRNLLAWTEGQRRLKAEEAARKERLIVHERKGEELLASIIGESEYKRHRELGEIDVPSIKEPAMAYRIRSYCRIGVLRLEKGRWRELPLSLFIHPPDQYKYMVGDLIATHVLLCKMNEEHLEKAANLHRCYAA